MSDSPWIPDLAIGPAQLPAIDAYRFAGKLFFLGTTVSAAGIYGADGNDGQSTAYPVATITQAVTMCVAGRGDVIYALPGHAQTLSTTVLAALSKSGISLIGLGDGDQRPTFTLGHASAVMTLSAAGVSVENCIFVNGVASQTTQMTVSAAGCIVRKCEFRLSNSGATTHSATAITTTAAANRLLVEDCVIRGEVFSAGAAVYTNGITIVGGTGIVIRRNRVAGRFSATLGAIQVITTATTNLTVEDNTLENWVTSAAKTFVDTITGSTGRFRKNTHQILTGTAPITAATMSWGNDVYAAAVQTAMVTV